MGPKVKGKVKGLRFRASWSDQSILRLLNLILASPAWRLAIYAMFNGNDAKIKDMWRVYQAIQCEFYQNDLVWRDCMVKDKLVKLQGGRWKPTGNWTSATYDPVEAKLRVLKEKREEIRAECKLDPLWTEFSQVPKPQQKALKMAYPYYFHLQRLYLNKAPDDPALPPQSRSSAALPPTSPTVSTAPRVKVASKTPTSAKTPERRRPIPRPIKTVLPEIIDLTSSPPTPVSSHTRPPPSLPRTSDPLSSSKRRKVSQPFGSAIRQANTPTEALSDSSSSASSTSSDDLTFSKRPTIRPSVQSLARDTANRSKREMSPGEGDDHIPLIPSAEAGPSSRPMRTRPKDDSASRRTKIVRVSDGRASRTNSAKALSRSVSPPVIRARQRTPEGIVRRRTMIQTGAIIPVVATGRQRPARPRRPILTTEEGTLTTNNLPSSRPPRSSKQIERFLLPEEPDTEDSSDSPSPSLLRRSASPGHRPDTPPLDGGPSGGLSISPGDPSTRHPTIDTTPTRPETPPLDDSHGGESMINESAHSRQGESPPQPDPNIPLPSNELQRSTGAALPSPASALSEEQTAVRHEPIPESGPFRPPTPPLDEPAGDPPADTATGGAPQEHVVPISDLLERARSKYFDPTWLNDVEYREFVGLQARPNPEREQGEKVVFNRAEARMLVEAYERISHFAYRPMLLADVRILIPFEMNDETTKRAIQLFKSCGIYVCRNVGELVLGDDRENRYVLQSTFGAHQYWERRDTATGYWIESTTVLSLLRKVDRRFDRDEER